MPVLRSALIALAALLPVSALAAEPPMAVDLVAAVIGGIADAQTTSIGGYEHAAITRTGPGAFEIAPETGDPPMTLSVVETAPCVFTIAYVIPRYEETGVLIDMNRVASISFRLTSLEPPDLPEFLVDLGGEPGITQVVHADGSLEPGNNGNIFGTSMGLVQLYEAAKALRANFCPGLGG